MTKVFANSRDPDQTCSAASDLSLHCLPITLSMVSRIKWVNIIIHFRVSVSRAIKPYGESNRPPDWFSQKVSLYFTLLTAVCYQVFDLNSVSLSLCIVVVFLFLFSSKSSFII